MSVLDGRLAKADQLDSKAASKILLKRVMVVLERNFPGWLWVLGINDADKGGIITLRSDRLHPEWGMLEKIQNIQDTGAEKWALKAGGEILERFRCKPGPYIRGCLANTPRDARGHYIPDITDQDRAKVIRQQQQALSDSLKAGQSRIITLTDGDTRHSLLGVDYGGDE